MYNVHVHVRVHVYVQCVSHSRMKQWSWDQGRKGRREDITNISTQNQQSEKTTAVLVEN